MHLKGSTKGTTRSYIAGESFVTRFCLQAPRYGVVPLSVVGVIF